MDLKKFGLEFAKYREESGFRSQRELAEKSGVSHSTINRIESGSHKASPESLKLLAPHLKGITYDELLILLGYREIEKEEKELEAKKLDYPFYNADGVQFIARSDKNLSPEAYKKMQELAKKAAEIFEDKKNGE